MEPFDEVRQLLRELRSFLASLDRDKLTDARSMEVIKFIYLISGFELGFNTAQIIQKADEHIMCDEYNNA